ncbi:MAG: NAD-dependent epimerase/dehydratase family protein [Anaerolineaceae bacterium]|nr:NAD-dependent epimerase/dehydratase family protein [Anaerolineaceae bacterium]MBN2676982.1 NAD-dependent epimerase/dehydratase family protein [Anaerolineaceae bacterium]
MIVTGGAGFLETMLMSVLLYQGYRVVVIDILLFSGEALLGFSKLSNLNLIKGDLCDSGELRPFLRTDWAKRSVLFFLVALLVFLPARQCIIRVWRLFGGFMIRLNQ